jgi:HEAT repeat protein
MRKPKWASCRWVLALSWFSSLFSLMAVAALAHAQSSAFSAQQAPKPATNPPAENRQPAVEKAWTILREGLKDKSADKRAQAVRALGLLPGNTEAEKAAVTALKDEKPNVRRAAAVALGSMRAEHSAGNLEEALGDSEPGVVLAAANSLLLLHDDVGYDTYYEVLTGERRASKGLIKEEVGTLKNKKKMAQMGIEEGIGFIPFGGIGYEIFKTVTKNDSFRVRAAAAKKLANDPAPDAAEALVQAAGDKDLRVRAAALDAIALREDPSLILKITAALDDEKDLVRFTAAACIAHLGALPAKPNSANSSNP